MVAYRGEFTIREQGQDLPARIEVFTADGRGSQSFAELTLAADPVLITWEDCALTDVVHRSQLQLNLVALTDGAYRDITQSPEPIYCRLLVRKSGDSSFTTWWSGAYADTTWLEPFSREEVYAVQLTFSDFGVLDRMDYSGFRFETDSGSITVEALIADILAEIQGGYYQTISWEYMPDGYKFNGYGFSSLFVSGALFRDGEDPRTLLAILTDVLEPLNLHMVQYDGLFRVFPMGMWAQSNFDDSISGTLEAAGTDAELESCGPYRRMELDYDPAADVNDEEKVDMTGFVPVVRITFSWSTHAVRVYADDGEDECRGMTLIEDQYRPLILLWMNSDKAEYFQYYHLGRPDAVAWSPSPDGITRAPFTLSLMATGTAGSIIYQSTWLSVKLSVWAAFDRYVSASLGMVRVKYRLTFAGVSGTRKYYGFGSPADIHPEWLDSPVTDDGLLPFLRWSGQDGGGSLLLDLVPTDRNADEDGIALLDESGRYDLEVDMSSISFSDGSTGNLTASPVVMVGFCGLTMSQTAPEALDMVDVADRIERAVSSGASEVFSRSFRMGTLRSMAKPDSLNVFIDPVGQAISATGKTMLDTYAEFVSGNYAVTEDFPVRRRVRGTYMYSHMDGLPIFRASMAGPLKTLARDDRAFFLMGEQWRLRSGLSQITIEEAGIGVEANLFNFSMPLTLNPPVEFIANEQIGISNDTFSSGTASVTLRSAYILGATTLSAWAYINEKGAIDVAAETFVTGVRLLRTRGVTAADLSCDTGVIGEDLSWTGKAKSVRILTRTAFSLQRIEVITMNE